MGSTRSKVQLSAPASLASLNLNGQSKLDDVLTSLLRAHDEVQVLQSGTPGKSSSSGTPGDLPPRQSLLVLLLQDSIDGTGDSVNKSVDDAAWQVLGGTVATKNGRRQLAELCACPAGCEECTYVCLASYGQGKDAPSKLRKQSVLKRWCRGCLSRSKKCAFWSLQRGVACLPKRLRDRLEPHVKSLGFYLLCARWAFAELWEERSNLIKEVSQTLLGDVSDIPVSASEIKEELRPFRYAAFGILALYMYRTMHQVAWAEVSPEVAALLDADQS
mmetsp:Transcript_46092/g.84465  ORF Transcript_46092/g.84465 Transcript_46092/m.84465 type:complete len:274 (+) Transcript_46092:46-867(+)